MSLGKQYVSFETGLKMGTTYLTENVAYFLGGVYASEEQVEVSGKRYRIAPVRYNFNTPIDTEIAEHYELVRQIAQKVSGNTVMVENIRNTHLDSGKNRMPGFSTFFEVTTLNGLIESIPALKDALIKSESSVQRSFLVGMFDGRSSPDIDSNTHKIRMLALDCISDEVGSFLSQMVNAYEIKYNYNTHRDRLEGGRPRNPQLRIKDVDKFMREVGLISPRKVNLMKNAYEYTHSKVEVIENSEPLPGLKTIIME